MSTPEPAPSKPVQVNFRGAPDRVARVRSAFENTRSQEKRPSWSEFLLRAVEDRADELQRRYNNGQPWPLADGQR